MDNEIADNESVVEVEAAPPFEVPATYALEPELQAAIPRPKPSWVAQGRLAREQRSNKNILLATGLICLVFSRVPFIELLAPYILPLGYLSWIGIGSLLLGGVLQLVHAFVPGRYRYLRDGVPLVVRIVELIKAPSSIVNGEAVQHAFTATVDFEDPQTGEVMGGQLQSSGFASSQKDTTGCSYRVGDYVTALYLPGKYPKTLQLYGFLDLKPDLGLVRREAKTSGSFWKSVGQALALAGFFFVLFWNVYAFQRFQPIDFDLSQALIPMVAGAVLLGGGFLAYSFVESRREQRRQRQRLVESIESGEAIEVGTSSFWGRTGFSARALQAVLIVGAPLMGAMIFFCWAITANAMLDRSEAQPQPVVIEDLVVTTHAFIFREYAAKFRLGDSEETETLWATPDDMVALMINQGETLADVREGRFGWPWVDRLRPSEPVGEAMLVE